MSGRLQVHHFPRLPERHPSVLQSLDCSALEGVGCLEFLEPELGLLPSDAMALGGQKVQPARRRHYQAE